MKKPQIQIQTLFSWFLYLLYAGERGLVLDCEAGLSFELASAAAVMGYVFGLGAAIVWTHFVPKLFKGL